MSKGGAVVVPRCDGPNAQRVRDADAAAQADRGGGSGPAGTPVASVERRLLPWNAGCFRGTPVASCVAMKRILIVGEVLAACAAIAALAATPEPGPADRAPEGPAAAAARALPWLHSFAATA